MIDKMSSMFLEDLESSKSTVTFSIAVGIFSIFYIHDKFKKKDFPSSVPFPFNQFALLELVHILVKMKLKGLKNFDDFYSFNRCRYGDIFYFGKLFSSGHKGPVLTVAHPDDQIAIVKKERDVEWIIAMPETASAIHGPGNFQELSGKKHSILRKVYSAILSPKALESFSKEMIQIFTAFWEDMEKKDVIELTMEIKQVQLKLMSKILFGFDLTLDEDKKAFDTFAADFLLTEKALFASSKSTQVFQDGLEARNRIANVLFQRFDDIFRGILSKGGEMTGSSAMHQIAAALIESGCTGPSCESSNGLSYNVARENLYLLLEASHGTTMYTTSLMMYFLASKENHECLEKVRQEVDSMEPSYTELKNFPFGTAIIKETMRMAPIVGMVTYHVQEGKKLKIKDAEVTGPINLMLSSSHWYGDPDTFPEPKSFSPKRWLEGTDLSVSEFAKSVFKPFGFGRHVCLGYPLANLVLKANLYCFASKKSRRITFDETKVKIVDDIFPMKKVSGDFPCQVIA